MVQLLQKGPNRQAEGTEVALPNYPSGNFQEVSRFFFWKHSSFYSEEFKGKFQLFRGRRAKKNPWIIGPEKSWKVSIDVSRNFCNIPDSWTNISQEGLISMDISDGIEWAMKQVHTIASSCFCPLLQVDQVTTDDGAVPVVPRASHWVCGVWASGFVGGVTLVGSQHAVSLH